MLVALFAAIAVAAVAWAYLQNRKLDPMRQEVLRLRAEIQELTRKREGRKEKAEVPWKKAEGLEKDLRRAEGRLEKEAKRAEHAEAERKRLDELLGHVKRDLKEAREARAVAETAAQAARREAEAARLAAERDAETARSAAQAARSAEERLSAAAGAEVAPAPQVDLEEERLLARARMDAAVGELRLELEEARRVNKRDADRARIAEARLREIANDLLAEKRRAAVAESLADGRERMVRILRGRLEVTLDLLEQHREAHGTPFPRELDLPESAFADEPKVEPLAWEIEKHHLARHPERRRAALERPAPRLLPGEVDQVDVALREEREEEAKELARRAEERRSAREDEGEGGAEGARGAEGAPREGGPPPRRPERRIVRAAAPAAAEKAPEAPPAPKEPRPAGEARPPRKPDPRPAERPREPAEPAPKLPEAPAQAAEPAPGPAPEPAPRLPEVPAEPAAEPAPKLPEAVEPTEPAPKPPEDPARAVEPAEPAPEPIRAPVAPPPQAPVAADLPEPENL